MSNPWDPNSGQQPGTPPPPPGTPQPGATPPPPAAAPPPAPQQPQQTYPPQPPSAGQPGGAPPYGPPPAAPTPAGGGGKGAKIAVGVVGVLLLGGAGAFAVTSMSGDSGPGSPEEAVNEVLESVDNEDILGFLGAIDPGERDALRDNAEQVFGELERLEVLDESFEADGLAGVDLTIDFDSIEYDTEEIREGLVRVEITDGDVEYSVDPAELPVGDLVTDLQERFGGDDLSEAEADEGTEDFSDLEEPFYLVARDTGSDGWRVSVAYTIAEYARIEAGEPDLEDPIEAIGEDSPEAAVEEFLRALEGDSVDTEELVARLSPSEFGALHEYLPTFVGSLPTEDYDGIELTLDEIELSSDQDGDTALVTVDALTVTVEETNLDESIVLEWDGECLSIDASDAESIQSDIEDSPFGDEICAGEEIPVESFSEGIDLPEPPDFGDLEFGTYGIATARVDGDWYIAPIDTGLTAVNTTLAAVDREVIEATIDYADELFSTFFFGFGAFDDMGVEFPDDAFGDPDEVDPFGDDTVTDTVPDDGTFSRDDAIEQLELGGLTEDQAICVVDEMEARGIDFEEANNASPDSEIFEQVVDISADCIVNS